MPDLQGDASQSTPPSDGPVCNVLDSSTWPACGQQLGSAAGDWLNSNACGDLCIDGKVVASRPCPPGRAPTSLGCGSKQLPQSPPTTKEKAKEGINGLLDRYSSAIMSGDPLAVVGTVVAAFAVYKIVMK